MHRSDFHEGRSAQTIIHLHYIVWPVFFHGSCDLLKCLVRLLDTIQSEFQEVKALMARWIRDPCKEAMVIRKKCTGFAFKPPQWEGQNLFWDIPSRYLSTNVHIFHGWQWQPWKPNDGDAGSWLILLLWFSTHIDPIFMRPIFLRLKCFDFGHLKSHHEITTLKRNCMGKLERKPSSNFVDWGIGGA